MISGQKPKPARLRIVEGNPGHRPVNTAEPDSPPLDLSTPDHLTPSEAAAWAEIVEDAPPHVLRKADRLLVETTARLLAQVRSGPLRPAEITQLRMYFGELGMTPSARARLAVPPPPTVNPFEGL